MRLLDSICWFCLAAMHGLPSLPLFSPTSLQRLYGVNPGDELSLLLRHRSVLFVAVTLFCLAALFKPQARVPALALCSLSMLSFLALYGLGGFPGGALQKIAIADALGLIPLVVVTWLHFHE